jgi:hypothetical protein
MGPFREQISAPVVRSGSERGYAVILRDTTDKHVVTERQLSAARSSHEEAQCRVTSGKSDSSLRSECQADSALSTPRYGVSALIIRSAAVAI